jgi:phosphoglycolate phosphatase
MSRFKTVLFDLEGTLTDPWPGITRSMQYALQKLNRPVPEEKDLLWTIGPPIRENLALILGSKDQDLIEQGVDYYRERFGTTGLFENEVYPQVPEMLTGLKSLNVKIILATAKPLPYAQLVLDHFLLSPYFDAVYGSEFNGVRSDKRLLIEYIIEQEKFPVQTALMVGDRMHDIVAAKHNGIKSAGVTYGYGSLEELKKAKADYFISKPEDLLTLVRDEDFQG